jgi:3-oxoacyl-[acyl-carrier protein] reductase
MYCFTKEHFGFVDTVINNAGVACDKILADCTEADFDKTVGINQKGVFNVSKAYSPDMTDRRFGRIINISSVWGEAGASAETLYSMTKAGVIGFTKALAKELAPSGVTVNAIAPGLIDTAMNKRLSKSDIAEFLKSVPLGRIGLPSDVAAAALFLASGTSGYITAQTIGVNGGMI